MKELESQKERLAAYSLQARFALASIYDRASSGGAIAEARDEPRYRCPLRCSSRASLARSPLQAPPTRKPKSTGTIKDLESREVQVVRDPPTDVKPQQAIEQYRHFLELQSDNEKMRTEAMRRLGDLQVEVDEGARAAARRVL